LVAGLSAWRRAPHDASDHRVPSAESATSAIGSAQIGRCNERRNGRSSIVAARAASQTSVPMPTPLVDHGSNNATSTAMRSTLSMRANGSCRAEAMTDSIEPIEFISLRG
jgi:hypothetical protein